MVAPLKVCARRVDKHQMARRALITGARAQTPSAPNGAGSIAESHPELLERVPAIIYIADAGGIGRWRYVSPQIRQVLGFSPQEWCADPQLWAERLHPDDRERVLSEEEEYSTGRVTSRPTEYRMLHRDGHVVWIRDEARLVRDGGALRWHGVLSDVTERKQVEIELERRAAQQAAVARLGEHALERATTAELMQEAVDVAADSLAVDFAGVAELVADQECFILRSAVGVPQSVIGRQFSPVGTASQAGYTLITGSPVVVSDWATEERFGQSPALSQMGTRSGLSVVVEGRDGPFGVLGVQSQQTREYSDGDVDFLQSLANVLADALARQSTEDEIRHRALHDRLTGLPNRELFQDRLDHAIERLRRRRSLAAMLFLDLDHFKLINDSLGHHLGDELLTAVATRLKQAVRASDTVARFGGDEFGILLEDVAGEQDAIDTAERVAALFSRPFAIAGREHFVTVSIGIVLAEGGAASGALIRDADTAMYRAKERGRARYEVFDDAMRDRAIVRVRIENELRRALERDELRLDYQPIVSLGDYTIVGAEALLRWDQHDRTPIDPGDFVPVAEQNGLIEPIGQWVLDRACRQAAQWGEARADSAPIGISVNLSGTQLANRRIPEIVAGVLRDTRLDPACLSLEITESVLLADAETLAETLPALKRIGVRLVLDDFGTGYSSFSYLTRLPLDALKVDRSYVDGLGTEPRDTAITEAIIVMSHALSLQVIGEGVETSLHVAELRRLGCDLVQGFHVCRPVPASGITRMLRDGLPVAAAV
jgi:diguanylate cyclase (GGDEF)-like protein/PAS domain S-box-containing protein